MSLKKNRLSTLFIVCGGLSLIIGCSGLPDRIFRSCIVPNETWRFAISRHLCAGCKHGYGL